METAKAGKILDSTWKTLKYTYGIVPIVAGLDKFTDLLTNWGKYLNPRFAEMLPFSVPTFMSVVGVIEIISGLLVFFNPFLGGLVVMGWLICLALNLLGAGYYDIAVRD